MAWERLCNGRGGIPSGIPFYQHALVFKELSPWIKASKNGQEIYVHGSVWAKHGIGQYE